MNTDNTATKRTSFKKFLAHVPDRAELIRAVVNQMGGWENFEDYAPDINKHGIQGGFVGINKHGIQGGFVGFTYYSEMVPFAIRNRRAILDRFQEQAHTTGSVMHVLGLMGKVISDEIDEQAAFWYLSLAPIGKDKVYDHGFTGVWNWFAWAAAELVAQDYMDYVESES